MQCAVTIEIDSQHIPLALLAAIPPIIAELMEAGSGPIFLPNGFKMSFALEPITPGSKAILSPFDSTLAPVQFPANKTRTESVIACPERLVPAALNVTGISN